MNEDFTILTLRLRLEALSLDEVEALIAGDRARLERRAGVMVPAEWPAPRLREALPEIAAAMAREEGDARWGWVVIEQASARVIGDIGFHGPLLDGATAEIGYILLPEARGQGFVTEAAAALIAWVFAHTGVSEVIAQIAPDNAASLRVAAKLGMREQKPDLPDHRRFGVAWPPGS